MSTSNVLKIAVMAGLLLLAAMGTASAQDGAEIYSTSCSSCHGPDGEGMLPGQPDFTDPATWEGVSEERLITLLEEGGRIEGLGGEGSSMQPDGGSSLSDAERQAVTEYIMGLAPEASEETGGETGGETGETGGESGGAPGFTALFAVTGLLAVAFLLRRR